VRNLDFHEINVFENFLSSYNAELLSKVSRLDELIGRDHWLSVGNYKESILRSLLSNILPRKYEISTGFILASDREGRILKSRQIDIIIWDSANYAPIFRDGDFVIVPPESCSAVVEVKGKLTHKELENSLLNIDSLTKFCSTAYPFYNHIRKYIFAYDISKKLKFPHGLWQVIANTYTRCTLPALEQRMALSKKKVFPTGGCNRLFSIDAVFVLPFGAIKREFGYFSDTVRFMFESYLTASETHNHTYAYFESDLQANLLTDGEPGSLYVRQPGLFSVKRNMGITSTTPKSLMIFPPLEHEGMLYEDIHQDRVFVPKASRTKVQADSLSAAD
jgi:hypothetical protein